MLDARRGLGRRAVDPPGLARERMLAQHLPYLSMVDEDALMLRDGDVMGSLVARGVAARTAEQADVDDLARAMAGVVAQAGPDVAFYVHRVSHPAEPSMIPVEGSGLAAQVDRTWQAALRAGGLRERVSMVSVVVRPRRLTGLWARITGGAAKSRAGSPTS